MFLQLVSFIFCHSPKTYASSTTFCFPVTIGGSSPVRSHVYRTPILAGGHGGNFRYPVKKNVVDDAYVFGEWQKINDTSCLNIYKKESNEDE